MVKYFKGQKKLVFKPIRERNEALDTFVYCLAAFHILQPNLERIASNDQKESKRTPPPQSHGFRRPPKKSFVNSWK